MTIMASRSKQIIARLGRVAKEKPMAKVAKAKRLAASKKANPKVVTFGVCAPCDPRIDALVAQRQNARDGGDFAEADRIRDELAAEGISIEDRPDGPRWRRG